MIEFMADRVSLRGPKVDGTWVVSFDVGQYEASKLVSLLTVTDAVMKVQVEVE